MKLASVSGLHITPVRASQETHHVFAKKTSWLMVFRETVAVYCVNHMKHINRIYDQNILYVQAGGTYSYHCDFPRLPFFDAELPGIYQQRSVNLICNIIYHRHQKLIVLQDEYRPVSKSLPSNGSTSCCREQPRKGSPPALGLGVGLTTPHSITIILLRNVTQGLELVRIL
jgi:hypothetical protein